jgi:hypothetical protein
MHSSDLSLSHVYAHRRHQEFLAEAEQNHRLRDAFADRIPAPRSVLTTLRAGIAHSLFSIGAWLMPADSTPSVQRVAGNWELRLG